MVSLLEKHWRWIAWFMAGLLFTVLTSGFSNFSQPVTAASSSNLGSSSAMPMQASQPQRQSVARRWDPAFEEVMASHLEPNFYQ